MFRKQFQCLKDILREKFTWIVYLLVSISAIGIFALLLYNEPHIIEDRLFNLLDVLINAISISVGFFGAIFTLIFSLKDNPIVDKIMNSKNIKRQFKYMNYGIVISGFAIILLILVLFIFKSFKVSLLFSNYNSIVYFILCLSFYFYCMFGIYLYTISRIIFEKQSNNMKTKTNPPIKPKQKRK